MLVIKKVQFFCLDSNQCLALCINKWKMVIITVTLAAIPRMQTKNFLKLSGSILTWKN